MGEYLNNQEGSFLPKGDFGICYREKAADLVFMPGVLNYLEDFQLSVSPLSLVVVSPEEKVDEILAERIAYAAHNNHEFRGLLNSNTDTENLMRSLNKIKTPFDQEYDTVVSELRLTQTSNTSDNVKVWQPNYDSTGFSSDQEQSNVYNSFFCFIEWLNQGFAEIGGVVDSAINFAWELLDYSDLLGVESHSVELPHS
ncbi:MAG TPA: hypothetical protein QKA08_00805 [Candidatus Megaira endosymbiont of Nemacystus decipiens]|nr:hypothetical protein [Candidatus Megaera endosymbiont of Nemacystus decipiens]